MKNLNVYLSLGGNVGQVLPRLQQALALLSTQTGIINLKHSHFYYTAPLHMDSSVWFVNGVCSFQTFLTPKEVFKITQAIETQLGKVPKPKNAIRPIDIDFLFYDDQIYHDKELEIPHPSWKERLFVLIPLADLTKEIILRWQMGFERYVLQDLIQPLLAQSSQILYLLAKNPNLQ
jgi:2-amino-4-hydroxy-6-hydroxymethyldihydropteridine diphosphokinase